MDQKQKWTAAPRELAAETVEETQVSGKTRNLAAGAAAAAGFPQTEHVRIFEFLSLFSNRLFSYLMKLHFTF